MPNYEFGSMKTFKRFVDNEASRKDRYSGSVLLAGFDFSAEEKSLREADWQVADIIDYMVAVNPVLWALMYLRNPQKPTEPIRLYDYQKRLINCQNRFKLSRCGRQIGKTVCMCVDMLHSAMTNEHMRLLYVAPYMSHVMVLVDQTLRPLINDVPEISSAITKTQMNPYYSFKFKNGSIIEAMTAGSGSKKGTTIRGKSADKLYIDEMEFMGSDTMASVNATMASRPKSKLWVSSTPTGKREEFYHYSMDNASKFKCNDCDKEEVFITASDGRKINIAGGTPFFLPSHVSPLFTQESDDFFKTSYSVLQYQHEILAEWGEELEGVFRHQDIDICLSHGRQTITMEDGEEVEISYTYDDILPNPACKYIMGIDWNGEARGVQICIVEFNDTEIDLNGLPSKMFRVVYTEIVHSKEFTENSAVTRILSLSRDYSVCHIYADEGYGTIYIEVLKRMAMNAGMNYLPDIIRAVGLQSTVDVYDPSTRKTVSKHMKPFMVNNAARIVESHRIVLPDIEDEKIKLVGQMREYLVISRGDSGRPIYSKDNEDMLTAFMMALLGFTMEFSDLTNIPTVNDVEVTFSSVVSRADNFIVPRLDSNPSSRGFFGRVEKENWFTRYGAKERQPAFRELARSYGVPYTYTQNMRSEEEHTEQYNNTGLGNRYRIMTGRSSTGSPSRKGISDRVPSRSIP